jgi:cytochrome c oxidase assembly protein subunit 15
LFQRLAWAATGLALVVIVAGAWVRLTHAGLGCPDWPGCYGMVSWPSSAEHVDRANAEWGHLRMVESGKAFREMFHRYLAGFLGLVILALAFLGWKNRSRPGQPVVLPMVILALVIFQAALGMWTVTLLLKPAIVTAHLLGGMTTFGLLLWLSLCSSPRASPPTLPARAQRTAVIVALTVVCVQIALGGWVSTNYAALACTGFPTCHGEWWPNMNFSEGFRIWRGIGVDYEGGVLDEPARVAIQMVHRIWAVVVTAVMAWLLVRLWRAEDLRKLAVVAGTVLLAQISIGIYNVVGGLPLANAVAHNGMAAILLGLLLLLLDKTRVRRPE